MFCVYLTSYKGNKLPPFYIGSSSIIKIETGYHGSVTSKRYKKVWNYEIKNNPHLFKTIIISKHDTRKQALEKEMKLQESLNVVHSPMYINRSLAKPNGFFGAYHGEFPKPHKKPKKVRKLTLEGRKRLIDALKGKPSKLKNRKYEDIHGEEKANQLKDQKRKIFTNRTFSEETKRKMKENHADVSGSNNPNAIKGFLLDSLGSRVFYFSHLNELNEYCKSIGLPFRGLKSAKWKYDPVITNRNLKYKKFIGYHCVFDQ
jgi:hypothetical protein